MASPDRLVAVGIAPQAAALIGLPIVNVTATGSSSSANAFVLSTNTINIVTTGASTNSVRLPAGNPGDLIATINISSTTLNVYPVTGNAIDGGSNDAAVTSAQNKARLMVCVTSNVWRSLSVQA